jgi:hypothetical protein
LTPHGIVAREDGRAVHSWRHFDELCHIRFDVDDNVVIHAFASSLEHFSEICAVVVRLLAASFVHSEGLDKWNSGDGALINAPNLTFLMEQRQSLKVLTLRGRDMDEDQIRVLGAYSRPGLDIVMDDCSLTSAGTIALAEVLGRNQGPTKIFYIVIWTIRLLRMGCAETAV